MYIRFIKWLARFMTSPIFVGCFFGLIGFWIAFNTISPWKFDAPPFMALNLIMSALAGVQATAVAIAQREEEAKQQKRDEYMLHLLEAVSHLLAAQIASGKGGGSNAEGQADSGDGRPELSVGDAP